MRRWLVPLTFLLVLSGCGRVALDPSYGEDGSGGSDGVGGSTGGIIGGTGGTGGSTGGIIGGTGGTGGSTGGSGGSTGGATGGTGGSTGGTGGAGCQLDAECPTGDSCHPGRCAFGTCTAPAKDLDEDGFVDANCGGVDCNDLNPNVAPGQAEVCTDGADNDCNGVADCFDPVCKGAECGCIPVTFVEVCNNGIDDDCSGTVDCNDVACATDSSCGCSAERCSDGDDDDCDGLVDCDDNDCAGDANCLCQGNGELCFDDVDNDCDGLIDCSDPSCDHTGNCACTSSVPEDCDNGKDDDCDGAVDCGDPSCFSAPACKACTTENCTGGGDEDCDGAIDCTDSSCALSPACPLGPEECNNARDDDFDGKTDCDDSDCQNAALCLEKQNTCETAKFIPTPGSYTFTGNTAGQSSNFSASCGGAAGEAVFRFVLGTASRVVMDTIGSDFDTVLYLRRGSCEFGEEVDCDDDSANFGTASKLSFDILPAGSYFVVVDGLTIDPVFGANEGAYVLSIDIDRPSETCSDGIDNDGDIYADCADSDCANIGACFHCVGGAPPVAEFGVSRCTDGLDNDCDGKADCDDSDCTASESVPVECCNGIEESGNNIQDDFACRCKTSADCPSGQLCYTSTTGTCGIPCGAFFGDICPFLAPGSICNDSTSQCEF